MQNLFLELETLFKNRKDFWNTDGTFNRTKLDLAVRKSDAEVVKALLTNATLKREYFTDAGGVLVEVKILLANFNCIQYIISSTRVL